MHTTSRWKPGISSTRGFRGISPNGFSSAPEGKEKPDIEPKSERRHWDRFWERAHGIQDVYSNEGRVAGRIARLGPLGGKRVLEVGAGSGRDGIMLSRIGATVVSLDYSLPSLRLITAQLASGSSLSVCCGDAFALPFPDGTFDVVFHQGLLEHFRNPDDLIAEHARVLKPGGLMLVDVPQRYHYYTVIKHILIACRRWFAGWEREYSVGELERMLRRHSFSIVSSYGEWFNPPIWYRMLRRGARSLGVSLPMYPTVFFAVGKVFARAQEALLKKRWALYTTVVVGTIARKGE